MYTKVIEASFRLKRVHMVLHGLHYTHGANERIGTFLGGLRNLHLFCLQFSFSFLFKLVIICSHLCQYLLIQIPVVRRF